MPTSDNAQINYEAAQSLVDMAALTDSGDQIFFESADELWSNKSGFQAVVRPDGVVNGFAITPGTADDTIDVAAGNVYQTGVLQAISASAAESVPRPTLQYIKYSVTVDNSQAVVIVAGAENAGGFSTVRGAAGAAPYIPVGSTEIGQVWLSSTVPAAVLTSEIKQVPGSSLERTDFPSFNLTRINVTNGVIGNAGVTFVSALPTIHTGDLPKIVAAEYYTPEFTEWPNTTDFVPAETTNTVTSTQVYNNTLGASASTLNQSTFTAFLEDGITDPPLAQKNEDIFWKFFQDRLDPQYILQQGKLGVARTFPAADNIQAACTVSTETAAVEVFG